VRGSAPIARAPAGLEHAGDLGEHGWLVCAQVDDPVADDHVDRAGLHRHLLDVALFEAHVLRRSRSRVEVAVRVHSSAGESMVTRSVAGPDQVSPIRAYPVKVQAGP